MKPLRTIPLLALATLALAACGSSGTHVVNVPVTNTSPATSSSSSTTTTPSSSTTRTVTGTVRTATAPAFASSTTGGSAGTAVAAVQARGCSAVDPTQYHSDQTLRVLVGRCSGGEQAFFFVDGRYIGTDAKLPSSHVTVVSQNDTAVTLSYALIRPDGSSAGTTNVQFALDNGKLSPLDSIPSASPSAPVSRR